MEVIRDWFRRNFSDPQVVILATVLLAGTIAIVFMGRILAPVIASLIVAYLLDGIVERLERVGLRRMIAVAIVFIIFMAFLIFLFFGLAPMLSRQVIQVVQQLPEIITQVQKELVQLPERYPEVVSKEQIVGVMETLQREIGRYGQRVVNILVASVRSVILFVVYLVLMPLMVYFFLKDKKKILEWLAWFLPENRALVEQVWREVDDQIGNYIRGKVWEIFIVWIVSAATLHLLGLNYAMLIGLFVGLSVLIPYIGATVMAIPIALMGYFQWGWGIELFWVMLAYAIIQALDGNLLAPLLLSGVVNLHPIAIIVALFVFGGIWGFWGVFFAVPLATLVQAVLRAWPRKQGAYPSGYRKEAG